MHNQSNLAEELISLALNERHPSQLFIAGETSIPVTGKVFGKEELSAAVEASLDFWLTAGPYTEKFESRFAKTVGMRHAFMVSSGSSANLLALTSLTSPKHGDRALRPGDEVLTVAAGFPTTVTPILQSNLVRELTETLALVPVIAGLAQELAGLGDSILKPKQCVKGKSVKRVSSTAKCPKGFKVKR